MSSDYRGTSSEDDLPADVCACQFPYREKLPEIVASVIEKLEARGTVEHVCRDPLPNVDAVVRILNLLCEMLFPGYFSQRALDKANLPYHLGETLNNAYDLLSREIARCLMHERRRCGPNVRRECGEEGQRLAFALLERLPGLVPLLDGDVHAGYMGDPAATGPDEVIFCYPGFRAIMVHRIAHELHQLDVRWLPRMMTEYAHAVTGIDMHPAAVIGSGFFIDHGTGVVIGETTEIGSNVRLYQGVTLGGWSFKTDEQGDLVRGYKRHPTLEDDVIVYSNASILGPVTIGRGSVIGGNVMLTQSVPAGSRVFTEQAPPRVKKPEGS